MKSTGRDLDELYAYDEVYRLLGAQRGDIGEQNGQKVITNSSLAQQWDLDGLGNWAGFKEGTAVGTWTLEQTRDMNAGNEIDTTDYHGDTPGDAISSLNSTPNWADPVYDAAGNMTSLPQPDAPTASFTCTYDAWNRLVKVEDGANTVAEYKYDGLNRRIVRIVGSETRHYFLSVAGQVLEERVNTSAPADQQYVWGLRYVDELILRDRDTAAGGDLGGDGNLNNGTTGLDERLYTLQDANWNVTTLVTAAGTIAQRFLYDPYGTSHVLNDNFTDKTGGDGYEWGYRFTGQELDLVIGIHFYDSRLYAQHLGTFITHDFIPAANLYTYCLNNPVKYVDPSGMFPIAAWEWDAGLQHLMVFPGCLKSVEPHVRGAVSRLVYAHFDRLNQEAERRKQQELPHPIKWRAAQTPDEHQLIEMCKGDPTLIRKVGTLFDVLDRTSVFPFLPDRCHAWCTAFLQEYQKVPYYDSFTVVYQTPLYIGPMPLWKDHGVITFTLNGQTVYLDKRLQGGSDHIAFERSNVLIFQDDPRYEGELAERQSCSVARETDKFIQRHGFPPPWEAQ